MNRSYEPDADEQLDYGAEPPVVCRHCSTPLEPDEGTICPDCEDQQRAAQFDDHVDDEREMAWFEGRYR